MKRWMLVVLVAGGAALCGAPAARAAQLDSLRFMAGSWAGGDAANREEEHWSEPRGGLMVGMHRDLRGGAAESFEFFRIEERADGLYYLAQPGGRPATTFKAAELSASRVVFERADDDFPRRILYWREKPGELRARVEGAVEGKPRSMEWTWKAGELAPPAPPARPEPAEAKAALAAQREAMGRLAMLDGEWRGPASTILPSGEKRTITQTERVGTMLDGTVRVIEGRGYEADGRVGFNAFAVISYRPETKSYSMRSYAMGSAGDFALVPTPDGFVWEIPAGPTVIRYTATIRDGRWREVGERIVPGRPPARFIELDLARIGDSAWPAAGAVPRQ